MLKLVITLVVLAVASGAPVDKRLHALNAKMDKKAPSMHAKSALDAKLSLLREANSPNKRSKAMEKKALLEVDHKSESNGASAKVGEAYNAYDELKKKCVACKLAEDAVVSQLQLVVSLHDYADEKLDEYNTAKTAAEAASTKATDLEGARDTACEGAPEAEPTTPEPTTPVLRCSAKDKMPCTTDSGSPETPESPRGCGGGYCCPSGHGICIAEE